MYSNLAIGILGTSATFLGISILILATMRFGLPMPVVKERLTEKQYDDLYDGMLFSTLFGGLSVLLAITYVLTTICLILYFAVGFFVLQILIASYSAIKAFVPFKFWLKRKRNPHPIKPYYVLTVALIVIALEFIKKWFNNKR